MDLAVAIMTVKRRDVDYLSGTLASLRGNMGAGEVPVVLAIGNPEDQEIEGEDCSFIDRGTYSACELGGSLYKITCNMSNAYSSLLSKHPDAPMYAVFEDDVLFTSNWLSKAKVAARLASAYGPKWMVCLCTSYDDGAFAKVATDGGVHLWKHKDVLHFWGQQALLYSPQAFADAKVFIGQAIDTWNKTMVTVMSDSNHNYRRSGDQLIKWFCHDHKMPMYVSNPSLMKHVGATCSWSGGASCAFQHPTKRFVP